METRNHVNVYDCIADGSFPEIDFQVIAHDEPEALKLLEKYGLNTESIILEMTSTDVRDKNQCPLETKVIDLKELANEQYYERISDVVIYPLKDRGFAIKCKIDGEEKLSSVLLGTDLDRAEDKSNWKKLAVEYYRDDLQASQEEQTKRMSR